MKKLLGTLIVVSALCFGIYLYMEQKTEIFAKEPADNKTVTETKNTYNIKNSTNNNEEDTIDHSDDGITIVLDPGHGGYDDGSSAFGLYEKDITLQLALAVGDILSVYDIDIIYTREDDTALADTEKQDLRTRVSMANATDAAYYISFHLNASEIMETCYGFEIWTDLEDAQSTSLAQDILHQLDSLQYSVNRGLKDGMETPLYVIANTTMPSLLIEYGFLDNQSDAAYFSDDDHISKLAQATADGILKQLGLKEN